MHEGGEATNTNIYEPNEAQFLYNTYNLPELANRTWLAMAGERYNTLCCAAVIEQVSAGRTILTVRH
jgi:hypothetical protein